MSDSYAGLPSAPPPPPYGAPWQQPTRPPRPTTVTTAFGLMLLHCVLAVVSIAIIATHTDELKRKVLEKSPNASQATLDAVVPIALGSAVVGLVLYLGLALFVRAGKNWARIVTWVFAGLGILGVLVGLARPTIASSRALSLVSGVIDVVIVILLALAASNAYFRPGRQQYR